MMDPKFKTFAFTLRPRDGVTDAQVQKMEKYLKKNAEYYKLITEKTGPERHLHCAFVLKNEATRGNVCVYMDRMFKDLEPDEKRVMRQGLKVWYNRDFLSYLDKGDDTVVVCSSLPEVAYLDALFPPPPVPNDEKKLMHVQALLTKWEKLWHEHVPTHMSINTDNVKDFMWSMMFEKRLMDPILDDKRISQIARGLVRWMLKANKCTVDDPPYMNKEGEDIHPLIRH